MSTFQPSQMTWPFDPYVYDIRTLRVKTTGSENPWCVILASWKVVGSGKKRRSKFSVTTGAKLLCVWYFDRSLILRKNDDSAASGKELKQCFWLWFALAPFCMAKSTVPSDYPLLILRKQKVIPVATYGFVVFYSYLELPKLHVTTTLLLNEKTAQKNVRVFSNSKSIHICEVTSHRVPKSAFMASSPISYSGHLNNFTLWMLTSNYLLYTMENFE